MYTEQYIRILFMDLINSLDVHPDGWLYFNEWENELSMEYIKNSNHVITKNGLIEMTTNDGRTV